MRKFDLKGSEKFKSLAKVVELPLHTYQSVSISIQMRKPDLKTSMVDQRQKKSTYSRRITRITRDGVILESRINFESHSESKFYQSWKSKVYSVLHYQQAVKSTVDGFKSFWSLLPFSENF